MKAFQRFIHLSVVVAFLMASTGFRWMQESCPADKQGTISLLAKKSCCCKKPGQTQPAPDSSCQDMTCIVQSNSTAYATPQTATEQSHKCLQTPVVEACFTQIIRPALLASIPHFTLPPPASGRFLGILYQTFIL